MLIAFIITFLFDIFVSGKDSDPYSGVVRSNMRRSESIATTLPGFIMTAEPGSYEIITSIDLQTYLCASVSSSSVYAKSSAVEFDWSTQDLVFGTASVSSGDTNVHNVYENGVLYPYTTSANTVEGTSLHRLILQQAYVGPNVVNGLPRVYIRTSLLPSGRTATLTYNTTNHTNITHNNSIYSNSTNTTTSKWAASVLPLHGNSRFPQQITALAAHPFYPVLVAGTHTDDVILLNPSHAPSAEDNLQEVHPVDTNTHAPATFSADAEISTSALASLDSAEVKAAELRASRRALHRVGKALPRYDVDLPVSTHNEGGEVGADEKSISFDLEDAEMGDELPLVAPILSSCGNETGVQNGIIRYGEAPPGNNDDDNAADGDGGEDDCSLTQLIEQYEVDPSVLTAAQLARVREASSSADELLNSPLYKARQQMLRARAHHKADSALGNAVGKELELEVPDLAVFAATSGRGVGAIGSPGRGSDLSSGDGTVTTMENTACELVAVAGVVDLPVRVSSPVESSHRSLSAIHSMHQTHAHTQRDEHSLPQPAAKRAKMLSLFAASTASTTNTTNTATSGKNKLVINSSNNNKFGANAKLDVTTKSSSQTKLMNSASSGPSTSGDTKRNTLSKLLQPKTLPPPLPSRVTLPLPAPAVKPLSEVQKSSDVVTSINDPSSNSSRAVLSVINGNHGTAPVSGRSNTTIGIKRALTSARAVTAAPTSDKSKPKAVSNILSFFSASKK